MLSWQVAHGGHPAIIVQDRLVNVTARLTRTETRFTRTGEDWIGPTFDGDHPGQPAAVPCARRNGLSASGTSAQVN